MKTKDNVFGQGYGGVNSLFITTKIYGVADWGDDFYLTHSPPGVLAE